MLSELADIGCLFLVLTGGEVCCRPDLPQILELARDRGFAIRIMTNGTLLEGDRLTAVCAAEPICVDFSLYAADPARHDAITRVPGSHERTVRAIVACGAAGIRTVVKTVVMKHNVLEFEALHALVRRLGAEFAYDYALVPSDSGEERMRAHGLSESELVEFMLARIGSRVPPEGRRGSSGTDAACGAGRNVMAICPDGSVLPCLGYRVPVGSLAEQTVCRIWHSAELARSCELTKARAAVCEGCDLESYCVRCPGVAFAECGSPLDCSKSACMVARATRRAYNALVSA